MTRYDPVDASIAKGALPGRENGRQAESLYSARMSRDTQLDRLFDRGGDEIHPAQEKLTQLAVSIYNSRRERSAFFSQSLFGEPIWDMLLALYGFPPGGEQLSVTGLCYAAEVPPTTALRGLMLLEQEGLIGRERDRHDGRRIFVALTPLGHQLMTRYLSKVYRKFTAD